MSAFTKLILEGRHLTAEESRQAMAAIMSNGLPPVTVAAFLTALRMKGEHVDEIVGAARAMREHATAVRHHQTLLLDTCGTGGDHSNTFNISTTAAFVVAAGGVPVGKHGNRAASSRSGSADLLEALGANIALDEHQVGQCIDTVGIGFMFAPRLHPAMKHVAPVRKELGFRTIFNLLGPLCNPAGATHQIIGVFHPDYLAPMARAAGDLGTPGTMVVHNMTGIDELAPLGENRVATYRDGEVELTSISAVDCGLNDCARSDLAGGDAAENARITRDIFEGRSGAKSDTVAMNAGLAFLNAGVVPNLKVGVQFARDLMAGGKAKTKLDEFISYTRSQGNA
ncbi:MAG: anthranilate phosphoribosyltransferase [candidate division Zixibacteria bacterium]|nr:anthranilate phosphoribosyltransferase [candidate division Zixibacteria bacterium]